MSGFADLVTYTQASCPDRAKQHNDLPSARSGGRRDTAARIAPLDTSSVFAAASRRLARTGDEPGAFAHARLENLEAAYASFGFGSIVALIGIAVPALKLLDQNELGL